MYLYDIMNKCYCTLLLVFFLFIVIKAEGQSINRLSKYLTHNYTNDDFNSTVQIWGGTQLADGSFVFGNDRKLLHFDGESWSHITSIKEDSLDQIDNKVFSIFKAKEGEVYVGRNRVFGTLIYDSIGRVAFQPLMKDSTLTNIWSIYEAEDQNIVFTTSTSVVFYDPKTGKTSFHYLPLEKSEVFIESSVYVNNGVLLTFSKEVKINAPKEKLLYYFSFEDLTFKKVENEINVKASYFSNNQWYIVDYSGEVYHYNTKDNTAKKKHTLKWNNEEIHINHILLRNNLLWTATEKYGVVIFD